MEDMKPRIRRTVFGENIVPSDETAPAPKTLKDEGVVKTQPEVQPVKKETVQEPKKRGRKKLALLELNVEGGTTVRISNVTLRYIHLVNLFKYNNKESVDGVIGPLVEQEYQKVLRKSPEFVQIVKMLNKEEDV